jgi:hypothetical protein
MNKWDIYGKCKCGEVFRLPFGDLFHLHLEICPRCGESKHTFVKTIGRYVSKAKLFSPSTWFQVVFEEKR